MVWEGVEPREDLLELIRAYDLWDDLRLKNELQAHRAFADLRPSLVPYWAGFKTPDLPFPTPLQLRTKMLEDIIKTAVKFWRMEHGDKSAPGWARHGGTWGGPVTELILKLFEEAEIPEKRWPRRSTIRDAMRRLKLVK